MVVVVVEYIHKQFLVLQVDLVVVDLQLQHQEHQLLVQQINHHNQLH